MATIRSPFGIADHQTPTSAATLTVEVANDLTIIEPTTLADNMTLNVTPSAELQKGAILLVKVKTTGTETLTYGDNINSSVVTGVAGKTFTQSFMYDGTAFIAMGPKQQID